jgi:hypothetical protein
MYIAGSPALAGLIAVPPFAGAFSETWESFPASHGEPIQYLPDPTPIMAGFATIANPQMFVFDSLAPVGLGSSGPAQPSDGANAMTLSGLAQTASIVFSQPALRFGAHWGAVGSPFTPSIGDPALIAVSFYDSSNTLVGTDVFPFSRTPTGDGLLEWHGWASTIPFIRLTYTEDQVVIDGLQADLVPEPAALFPLVLGALSIACPHRRRSR